MYRILDIKHLFATIFLKCPITSKMNMCLSYVLYPHNVCFYLWGGGVNPSMWWIIDCALCNYEYNMCGNMDSID